MKLPHISIEYRDEETFAPDRVSLSLVFGFGLFWAWMWAVNLNGSLLFFPNNPHLDKPLSLLSVCVLAITLFCYGIFLKQFRKLFDTRSQRMRNRLIGTLALLAGTSLLWLLNGSEAHVPIVIASALLNGVGSAIFLMSFGVSTSVLDIAEAVTATSASLVVGTLAFVLVSLLQQAYAPLGAIACISLPAVECICLWHCSKRLVDKLEFRTTTLSVHTAPFFIHICAPLFAFGLVLGLLYPVALFEVHNGQGFESFTAPYILASIAIAALAMGAMIMQRQSNNFMFRTLLPLCALLLSVVCLDQNRTAQIDAFCLFGAQLIIEASVWVMLSDISQRFRISAFTVYGFGRGALALGAFAGCLSADVHFSGTILLANVDSIVIVALALLLFGMALLPKNIELRNTLKLGKHCPALHGDEVYATVDSGEMIAARDIDAPQTNQLQETGQPDHAQPEKKPDIDPMRLEAVNEIHDKVEADEGNSNKHKGRFKRKCAAVADTYLLSRRETEVLFLLAKGRNAVAIQEQFCISAGTANTHMRHIYRKLNVHSQQELIALVEETEVDDLDWDS